MLSINELKKYFVGKKVIVTGHTGFKGSYLCVLLKYLGAKVYGYSLKPVKNGLYDILNKDYKKYAKTHKSENLKFVEKEIFADIRDIKKASNFILSVKPDYVIHMAAQPLVIRGYEEPHYTYDINVMGTVNVLEAIRNLMKINKNSKYRLSFLNVTTDKVYLNSDLKNYSFKENDKLCGHDPYANSKSCSELVTYSYTKSFFDNDSRICVSTARAGNVIGGGDLNENRIIPDCYRAIKNHKTMFVRNPQSIRPYQYVLEPLILYLNILAMQNVNKKYEGNYNVGPDKKDCLTTKVLTEKFFESIFDIVKTHSGELVLNKNNKSLKYDNKLTCDVVYNKSNSLSLKKEAKFLRLDNKLIKKVFKYNEIFTIKKTMEYTAQIYFDMLNNNNIYEGIFNIILKNGSVK